ncbi:hypothetical protein LCGC14_1468030, partial [marine sediment metagenome]
PWYYQGADYVGKGGTACIYVAAGLYGLEVAGVISPVAVGEIPALLGGGLKAVGTAGHKAAELGWLLVLYGADRLATSPLAQQAMTGFATGYVAARTPGLPIATPSTFFMGVSQFAGQFFGNLQGLLAQ